MWMYRKLKKNNGSALTIVLFMLFMLSVVAIAVVALTGSELSMSVMTSDRSKAMQYAQAGAEKAAQIIDTKVAQAQEDARIKASDEIQKAINAVKDTHTDEADGSKVYHIPEGTLFYGIIDNSNPGDIKIIKKDELNKIFENEYKYQLNTFIDSNIVAGILSDKDIENGKYSYDKFDRKLSSEDKVRLLDSSNYTPITSVEVTSLGEYKSPSTGSTYKRSIYAEFEILTDKITEQVGYKTKVRVNKNEIYPSILTDKALVAQKNIISLDGKVDILGDVIDCGTMPVIGDKNNIDYNADSYAFGGIIAGVNRDNSSVYNFWGDLDLGLGIFNGLTDNGNTPANKLASALGITDVNVYKNDYHNGIFYIDGNVGTLSYLHSLYGSYDNLSKITVTGDTYARSAVIESESNYSKFNLKNLVTFDDLKIDGNNALVLINQDLVGLSNMNPIQNDVISSTAIVSGDSNLNIFGRVYVGGSSVYRDYMDKSGNKFVSGISIQKSDDRPAAAFEKDGNSYNENNEFYKYVISKKDYETVSQNDIDWFDCQNRYEEDTSMMNGSKGIVFKIAERAMHFGEVWKAWQNDVEYASYFNTGDIRITPDSKTNKLKGFCYGGVAANDTFYDPYNGFTEGILEFGTEVYNRKTAYSTLMDLFIKDPKDEEYLNKAISTNTSKKLMSLNESVNLNALKENTIYDISKDRFMFYGSKNVVLTNSSITYDNSTDNSTYNFTENNGSGIIYTKGDIYVKAGTTFKGILIAEGNIVFFGNAQITYDKNVVDDIIAIGDPNVGGPNIGGFFKHNATDVVMDDNSAIVQTITKNKIKCIKVISWKET